MSAHQEYARLGVAVVVRAIRDLKSDDDKTRHAAEEWIKTYSDTDPMSLGWYLDHLQHFGLSLPNRSSFRELVDKFEQPEHDHV